MAAFKNKDNGTWYAMMDSPIHYYAFEILSAVMHADERNRAMSEALGEDVYHYHLHVVYIPVVEKQILWSKCCKDKSLVGTVKETIMQVSSSKKWQSKPSLDENGNPTLTAKGKPILKKSYSVLQDDFFNAMRAAGYTDVERGERGSTEEHLTVTQFKVAQESARLESLETQVEKKEQQLQKIEQKTRVLKSTTVTLAEIDSMGRKTFTGKLELTPQEGETLKQLARKGVVADAVISELKQKLTSARKDARIWKERYEKLLEQTMTMLPVILMLRIFAKTACIPSPPHGIDDLLQLVNFLVGKLLPAAESRQESRQGALEGVLHKLLALPCEEFLPAYTGSDSSVIVLKQFPVTKPLQNGIGGGPLPIQPRLGKLRQTAGGQGLVIPDNIRENGFHFPQLIFCHIGSSFALLSVDKRILLQVDRNVKVNFLKVRGHPAVAVVRIRESIRCSKEPLNKLSSD